MDTFHTGLLFRALIVLVTIGVLVIAGLVIARREKRRASNPQSDQRTNPGLDGHRPGDWQEA